MRGGGMLSRPNLNFMLGIKVTRLVLPQRSPHCVTEPRKGMAPAPAGVKELAHTKLPVVMGVKPRGPPWKSAETLSVEAPPPAGKPPAVGVAKHQTVCARFQGRP